MTKINTYNWENTFVLFMPPTLWFWYGIPSSKDSMFLNFIHLWNHTTYILWLFLCSTSCLEDSPTCIHVHHYNVTYTTSDLSILLQWIRTFCYFKQCWYEYASASISVYIYKCFSWLYKFRIRTAGSSTRFFQSG